MDLLYCNNYHKIQIFECNCLESSQTIENISSYCFYDIADVNKVDSSQYTKIYEKGQLSNTYLPNVEYNYLILFYYSNQFPLSYCIGIQPDVRVDENVNAFMLMFIVTIRLSSYSNDIMIIFNIPTNNVNQNITISDICSNEVVKNVLNSFKIIDFSLFQLYIQLLNCLLLYKLK